MREDQEVELLSRVELFESLSKEEVMEILACPELGQCHLEMGLVEVCFHEMFRQAHDENHGRVDQGAPHRMSDQAPVLEAIPERRLLQQDDYLRQSYDRKLWTGWEVKGGVSW